MSKMYIRTKDGVYEVVGFDEECIIPSTLIKVKKDCCIERITHCCKDDIIKQADTIEELCDEFVLIEHYSDREDMYHHYRDKKSFIEDYIGYEHIDIVLRCYTIYGAIWTDKGLIYVAKLNDKGELELL